MTVTLHVSPPSIYGFYKTKSFYPAFVNISFCIHFMDINIRWYWELVFLVRCWVLKLYHLSVGSAIFAPLGTQNEKKILQLGFLQA